MRVAVCLSGQLRNFEYTYNRLYKYLLEPLSADVFFYGIPNSKGIQENCKSLEMLYNPKKYYIYEEDPKKFDIDFSVYTNRRSETIPYKVFYQYFNLKKVMELKREYEKNHNFEYDLVIRTRCDNFWFRSLNKEEIDNSLKNNNVVIPDEWDFKNVSPYGTSDVFAAGSSSALDLYATHFDNLHKYYTEGCQFHPETMMGFHLAKIGLNRVSIKTPFWFETPSSWKSLNLHHEMFEFDDTSKARNNC